MKIAAVIPSYNHAHYVATAVESVLAQERRLDEVIVVDDGSTDDTRGVIARFGDSVRYVHQKNQGLSSARNVGARASTCDWVAFLDADDWWLPAKIRLQEETLNAAPEAGLCYTGIWHANVRGELLVRIPVTPPARLWPQLRYRNCLTGGGSSVCARKDLLLGLGGFDESLTACEDWDLWTRLVTVTPFLAVSEPLTVVRVSTTGMSSSADNMLSNAEKILEGTLLHGLPRWRKPTWRRRIRSAQLFHASVNARAESPIREWMFLRRSIGQWPVPWFMPARYKAMFRHLRDRLWTPARRVTPRP